ncbi:MAG: dipeptidase [Eubacteriales bacterium]|jgi:membrane dipeptidase|nr:dipeptidase [Eubacteriales bacterium]
MFSDAHCDTITRIFDLNQSLFENDGHVDIKRLQKNKNLIQYYAIWTDPKYIPYLALPRCIEVIDKFYAEMEKNQIPVIKTFEDVDKGGALLSIEDGAVLGGRLSVLRMLYKLGVRAMTLTWNGRSEIGDGAAQGERAFGLSSFGIEVVKEMNRLGMIVDVSHLSERGFWDVVEVCDMPFIASHSNARAICNHWRNLTNQQISTMVNMGGFIGINFCNDFLSNSQSSVKDIIKHIEYILSLGGEDIVGFGADFDGVDNLPKEIESVEDMDKVISELYKLNYTELQIHKILYANLHRATRTILKNQK